MVNWILFHNIVKCSINYLSVTEISSRYTFTLRLFTLRTQRRALPIVDPFTTFLVVVWNLPLPPGSAPYRPLVGT